MRVNCGVVYSTQLPGGSAEDIQRRTEEGRAKRTGTACEKYRMLSPVRVIKLRQLEYRRAVLFVCIIFGLTMTH